MRLSKLIIAASFSATAVFALARCSNIDTPSTGQTSAPPPFDIVAMDTLLSDSITSGEHTPARTAWRGLVL